MIDDSGGTTNRFNVLHFSRSFEGKEDRKLLTRLKQELPGIALWALEGANRLIKNDGKFTQPESSTDTVRDLRASNQPLMDFIETHLDFDDNARVLSGDVWQAYRLWCIDTNTRLCTLQAFGRSLKQSLLSSGVEYRSRLRLNGKVSSGYLGLKLKPVEAEATPGAGAFSKPVEVKP